MLARRGAAAFVGLLGSLAVISLLVVWNTRSAPVAMLDYVPPQPAVPFVEIQQLVAFGTAVVVPACDFVGCHDVPACVDRSNQRSKVFQSSCIALRCGPPFLTKVVPDVERAGTGGTSGHSGVIAPSMATGRNEWGIVVMMWMCTARRLPSRARSHATLANWGCVSRERRTS